MHVEKVACVLLLVTYFETPASLHIMKVIILTQLSPTKTTNRWRPLFQAAKLDGNDCNSCYKQPVSGRNELVDYDDSWISRHQSTEGLRLLQSLSLPIMLLLCYTIRQPEVMKGSNRVSSTAVALLDSSNRLQAIICIDPETIFSILTLRPRPHQLIHSKFFAQIFVQ